MELSGRHHLNGVIQGNITNNGTNHHMLLDMMYYKNKGIDTPVVSPPRAHTLTQILRNQLENPNQRLITKLLFGLYS